MRRGKLEARIGFNLFRQPVGPGDVIAQHLLDALASEIAHQEPQLERAETPAQRHAVVHQVELARVVGGVEILRGERKRTAENVRIARVEGAQVHRSKHPLVRIDHQRVRALGAGEDVLVLGEDSSDAGVSGVDVQPEIVARSHVGDRRDGIDAGGRRCAHGRHHAERAQSGSKVFLD